jgi:hypothetical protein
MVESHEKDTIERQRIEGLPSDILAEHKNSWNEWNGIWGDVSYALYGYPNNPLPSLGECLPGLFKRPIVIKRLQNLYEKQPDAFDANSLLVLKNINACIDQFNALLEQMKAMTRKFPITKIGDPGYEYDAFSIPTEERPALIATLMHMEKIIDEARFLIYPELRPVPNKLP